MRYFVFLLIVLAGPVLAETVDWNGYRIHYTTFPSTLIPAAVAEAHAITRSRSRIVTNVVLRKDDQPVAARIEGSATNLLDQLFTLEFSEVKEDKAIYYLASQIIDERDTIRFKIKVTPVDTDETYLLEFTRQYFEGAQ